MATVTMRMIPGSIDLGKKPVMTLILHDGNVAWMLKSEIGHGENLWNAFWEILAIAVPEWWKRVANARGRAEADRIVFDGRGTMITEETA